MKTLLLAATFALAIGTSLSAQDSKTHSLPLVAAVTTATQVAVKTEAPAKPASEKSTKEETKAAKKKSGKMDYFLYDYGFWWTPVD